MTKYNSKNPVSGPFSQFWRQIFFPSKNPVLSHITSYGFLPPCQNLEKLMMQFQENAQTDRRTGKPLFYRTFQLLPRGPINGLQNLWSSSVVTEQPCNQK